MMSKVVFSFYPFICRELAAVSVCDLWAGEEHLAFLFVSTFAQHVGPFSGTRSHSNVPGIVANSYTCEKNKIQLI